MDRRSQRRSRIGKLNGGTAAVPTPMALLTSKRSQAPGDWLGSAKQSEHLSIAFREHARLFATLTQHL